MAWTMDTREFESVMNQLAQQSGGTDREILTVAGREAIFKVAKATPFKTGNARAGWWTAWRALGRSGTPGGTRRREGRKVIKNRVYIAEGGFKDNRGNRAEPSIEMSNDSKVITKGGPINYLFIVNAKGKSAGFMQRALDDTTQFFERQTTRSYDRLLNKFGSR